MKSESEVAQSCPTLATPWTAAYQAPPSMGFSRQKYWSGVPLPSPPPLAATNLIHNSTIAEEYCETVKAKLLNSAWLTESAHILSVSCLSLYVFSVQFSCSVMFNSLRPHGSQTPDSLSITNSRNLLKLVSIKLVMPSNHVNLCHPLLLSLQSFPASGSFPMSQFFTSGGQSTGV